MTCPSILASSALPTELLSSALLNAALLSLTSLSRDTVSPSWAHTATHTACAGLICYPFAVQMPRLDIAHVWPTDAHLSGCEHLLVSVVLHCRSIARSIGPTRPAPETLADASVVCDAEHKSKVLRLYSIRGIHHRCSRLHADSILD